ncbi:type VII secretion-associated serine protease mycosin [Amycolatopsis sp. lyj-84]|uniref:type VII secretion-associated serine protease mycosin n=1 Tax=Amycolatopsis sp. lyj-84 TaxID=2789284 RepID=UPI00397C6C1C
MTAVRRLSGYAATLAVLLAVTPVLAHAQGEPQPLPERPQECLPPPQETAVRTPWPQHMLQPQQVWPLSKGEGVTVAVVDTGVDAANAQFGGRVSAGADVTANGAANDDCLGHGTFVAGIVGAAPVAGSGFAGVAPAVTILPIRVATTMDNDKAGSLTPKRLADGIRRAVDGGAGVINVSAGTTDQSPELAAAVLYAEQRNVVVVASVANEKEQGVKATYPAAFPSVLAVGAVDSAGAHVETSAVARYVGLAAPGKDVISIGPGGPGHWQGSGTSYAAPFVAGTAALVRAYHRDLDAAGVRDRLRATAIPPAAAVPDPALGWGTVDPVAAVTEVLPGKSGALIRPPDLRPPPPAATEELHTVLAVAGVLAAIGGSFVLVWLARLVGSAHRRRWRPARTIRPKPTTEP